MKIDLLVMDLLVQKTVVHNFLRIPQFFADSTKYVSTATVHS